MPHLHYWLALILLVPMIKFLQVETFSEEFDMRDITVDAFESCGLRSVVRVFYAGCIPNPERPHGWLRCLLHLFNSIVQCTRVIIHFDNGNQQL